MEESERMNKINSLILIIFYLIFVHFFYFQKKKNDLLITLTNNWKLYGEPTKIAHDKIKKSGEKKLQKKLGKKKRKFAISKKWKRITIMLITNNNFVLIMIKWMIVIVIPIKNVVI